MLFIKNELRKKINFVKVETWKKQEISEQNDTNYFRFLKIKNMIWNL